MNQQDPYIILVADQVVAVNPVNGDRLVLGSSTELARKSELVRQLLAPVEEFVECDSCRGKPGSPTLCNSCLHNRTLINKLRARG